MAKYIIPQDIPAVNGNLQRSLSLQARNGAASRGKIGPKLQPKRISNPFKMWYTGYPPDWLMARHEVNDGGKLLYGVLLKHAGKRGYCYPGEEVLAQELGKSVRQIRRLIQELVTLRLIEQELHGPNPARYYFLEHTWEIEHRRIAVQSHAPPAQTNGHRPYDPCVGGCGELTQPGLPCHTKGCANYEAIPF